MRQISIEIQHVSTLSLP